MDVKKIHIELFNFLKTSILTETTFEFEDVAPIIKVSLNGYFSKDIIDTIISCLFQKGFDNLINSIPYKSLKGEYEIDQMVYEYKGRLKQELENIKFLINSQETIETSIIQKSLPNFNLGSYQKQLNDYNNYDEFVNIMESKFVLEIEKVESVRQEIIQRFAKIKSKTESNFKIEQAIIDIILPNIFTDLVGTKNFEGNYKDFERLMSGHTPTNKIGIKEISSMGTLVNWLISVKLIPDKTKRKIDWKFIAENLYTIHDKGKLKSEQFSKNGVRHHSSEIYSILKKYEAVIWSNLSQ